MGHASPLNVTERAFVQAVCLEWECDCSKYDKSQMSSHAYEDLIILSWA